MMFTIRKFANNNFQYIDNQNNKKSFKLAEDAKCIAMQPKFAKAGFTLAEVLITLGIIGIVAAMTIPTLIANTKGAKYRTKFKKAVSTLSQVALMNKANYGWDYAGVHDSCGFGYLDKIKNDNPENIMSVCALLNANLSAKTYLGHSNYVHTEFHYQFNPSKVVGAENSSYYIYVLSDGTFIGVRGAAMSWNKSGCSLSAGVKLNDVLWLPYSDPKSLMACTGFIDINGFNLPNEEIHCSKGKTSRNLDESCVVNNKDMKDVFPVVFHDSIVEGATNAAQNVLHSNK